MKLSVNPGIVDQIFHETAALRTGHFKLRSGLHSDKFFQAAYVFMITQWTNQLASLTAEALPEKYRNEPDLILSPALGGMLFGFAMGGSLKLANIFAEKENVEGTIPMVQMVLRRGFMIPGGAKVLIVEDVVTKGGRVQQCIDLVKAAGGTVSSVLTLVDRSKGSVDFGVPFFSVTELDLPTYEAADCPLCKQGIPLDTPGSK